MEAYNLDIDEAVIMQASKVLTDTNASVDLVLTNKSLIQINRGFFGGQKSSIKYPLSKMKVLNGKPNIIVGKSFNGNKQLELYFSTFELFYRFNAPFTLNKWANAISKAYKERMAELAKEQKAAKPSIFDSVKESLDKMLPIREAQNKINKCSKCGAELVGAKGEQVTCEYCDNVVIIK